MSSIKAIEPVEEDLNRFSAWVRKAAPGSWYLYHRGFLTKDRDSVASKFSKKGKDLTHIIGDLAMRHWEQGNVLLVQRKLGRTDYEYHAVRTDKGIKP